LQPQPQPIIPQSQTGIKQTNSFKESGPNNSFNSFGYENKSGLGTGISSTGPGGIGGFGGLGNINSKN
jgi:hypothetical protein